MTDFGLAKLFGSDDAGHTQTGAILGTPSYIAPEQAAGVAGTIGPATDVYALGAILYELLTGRPPFKAATVLQTLELVRSTEPVPPRRLQPAVPRDLETICLTALQKNPQRRYASAQALAGDLRRFQNGEPIRARPTSTWERLRKWARRRPAAAALVLVSACAVIVFIAGVSWYNVQLQDALATAQTKEREAHTQEQAALAASHKATENLKKARRAVDVMLTQVGHEHLNRIPQLLHVRKTLLEEAVTLYRDFLREDPKNLDVAGEAARTLRRLGDACVLLGNLDAAQAAHEEGIDICSKLLRDRPQVPELREELALQQMSLGTVLRKTRRPEEASDLYRESMETQKQLLAESPRSTRFRSNLAVSLGSYGSFLRERSRFKEAEKACKDSVRLLEELARESPNDPARRRAAGVAWSNLANLLHNNLRQLDAADNAFQHAAKIQGALVAEFADVADYRREFASLLVNFAYLVDDLGRPVEAEQFHNRALAIQEKLIKDYPDIPEHEVRLADNCNMYGSLLHRQHRLPEGEKLLRRSLAIRESLQARYPTVPDHLHTVGMSLNNLALLVREQGQVDEACGLFEKAIINQTAALKTNPKHPTYGRFLRTHYVNLLETLVYLRQHDPAARSAAKLADVFPANADVHLQAAGYLARCIPLAEQDARLAPKERSARGQAYAAAAVKLLDNAVQKGYRNSKQLRSLPDLEPLRSRPDFERLVKKMEKQL